MSLARDASIRNLDCCGGCAGVTARTPLEVVNRPGLSAVSYRVGAHGDFRRSLLAGLSSSRRPALQRLRTRDEDDFTIALLDAWAVVADVLTFYQERAANELYLRTATERASVVALAAELGYVPSPGVAASTHLAFSLEKEPGWGMIDEGTRVQSLPGPGETPQTFETIETIDAHAAWNTIGHRLLTSQALTIDMPSVVISGLDLNLNPGDAVLIGGDDGAMAIRRVRSVTPTRATAESTVELETEVARDDGDGRSDAPESGVWALRVRAAPFGHNAPLKPKYDGGTFTGKYVEWGLEAIDDPPAKGGDLFLDAAYERIRVRSWVAFEDVVITTSGHDEVRTQHRHFLRVREIETTSRADYGLSGRVTHISLTGGTWSAEAKELSRNRLATVYTQAEPLTTADVGDTTPVYGASVSLALTAAAAAPPQPGRTVLFAGPRARVLVTTRDLPTFRDPSPDTGVTLTVVAAPPNPDDPATRIWRCMDDDGDTWLAVGTEAHLDFVPAGAKDPVVGEAAVVHRVAADVSPATIELTRELANVYDRALLQIQGNVAAATHGETRVEVLGSGDGSVPNQTFSLRQAPLTYVPASTPSGGASTLRVRVDDLLWTEVDSLFGHGPREHIYITAADEDGRRSIRAGDGREGARIPTGYENVRAEYRQGIGLVGEVGANQLNLLMTRPLGVRSVANPLAAAGAEDPETIDAARGSAPLTVLTLDRIVSLADFADFARSFGGIAKATASWTWTGSARGVLVTVSGENGDRVSEGELLHGLLLQGMTDAGTGRVPLTVRSYEPVTFRIMASLLVDSPTYMPERVVAAVRSALTARFSFAARGFGQSVAFSEVVSAIQSVPGVIAVDVTQFYRGVTPDLVSVLVPYLPPAGVHVEAAQPAEILMLDPASLADIEVRP